MQLDGVELLLELIESGGSEKIRKLSAETVAAAAQGNSKVKVEFVNGRAVSRLLTQVIQAKSEAWTKKLLYPLGAIIRDFPYAESVFYRHGGAQARLRYYTFVYFIFERNKNEIWCDLTFQSVETLFN